LQIQPLDTDFPPFLVLAQSEADRRTRELHGRRLQNSNSVCGREHHPIGAFATDGDQGCDHMHQISGSWNLECFERNLFEMSSKQHYRAFSDGRHIVRHLHGALTIIEK
jgi:hypothetical protein